MTKVIIESWKDLEKVLTKNKWETSAVCGNNVYFDRTDRWFLRTSDKAFEYSDNSIVKLKCHYPMYAELDDFSPTEVGFYDTLCNDDIKIKL